MVTPIKLLPERKERPKGCEKGSIVGARDFSCDALVKEAGGAEGEGYDME